VFKHDNKHPWRPSENTLLTNSRIINVLVPAAIFALNFAVIYPLFMGEYTSYMGSIESAFLDYARFIAKNYPNLNWNPLQYCGYPFHLFNTPFLSYTIAFLHMIFPAISIAQGYRIIVAIMYAFGPVTLYFFTKYLTQRWRTALLTATMYSLIPSFLNGIAILNDTRLIILTVFGEGPHVIGLTVIPVAALTFLHALQEPGFKNYVVAAMTIAVTALINLIAVYSLAFIITVILLSELILGEQRRKFKAAAYCGLIGYGLVAFQYDTPFISASLGASGPIGKISIFVPLLMMILFFPLLLWVRSYFSGKPKLQAWFICLLWTSALLTFVLIWHLFKVALIPQLGRLMPELNMGIAIMLGLMLTSVYDRLKNIESRFFRGKSLLRMAYMLTILIMLIVSSFPFLRSAWILTQPNPNITESPEYRIAEWLSNHVEEGERVYVTGSVSFWLNVFSDVPQLRGVTDQGATNRWWDHVTYQVNKGSNGSLAVLWFKALNIRYVVVNYPNASTPYYDYAYPYKFEKLLPLRQFFYGFGIFEIPLKHKELVQAVDIEKAQKLRPIENVLDNANLLDYVNFVENSSINGQLDFKVMSVDEITINVRNFKMATGILVKMTFDERWKAYVDGTQVPITAIGPEFMLIQPSIQGDCAIRLVCSKATSEILGLILSSLTVVCIAGYWFYVSLLKIFKQARKVFQS